jgi:hypothetical protein
MSPHHFAKLNRSRQSQTEREIEERVEHALSFAFSPVRHPVKAFRDIKRLFKRGQRQSES